MLLIDLEGVIDGVDDIVTEGVEDILIDGDGVGETLRDTIGVTEGVGVTAIKF